MPEEVNYDIDLQEHFKNLIEGSPTNWTYAILWQFSPPQRVFKFESGYYSGTGKAKEVCILGSCVTVTEEANHAESEWFFKISEGQSFRFDEDFPGYAYSRTELVWVNATDIDTTNASTLRWGERHKWGTWERTKWGHQLGIQTFLCIPLEGLKVLELASTQIIPYDPEMLKQMEPFINPIGTPVRPRWGRERVDNEMQNRGNNNLCKPSRGKEKISDSKCSWSLLTESSDRVTFSCSHDYSGPS